MIKGISVFGLGYVGCVSAACFARDGFNVIGVDKSQSKVDLVNSGSSTIVEEGVAELVANAVRDGRLQATVDASAAVTATDISLVAVGTPSRANGSIDLGHIEKVCEEIGAVLKTKPRPHTVVIRSTILPGTMESIVIPALERSSGKTVGPELGVAVNPEFLREGSSLKDFYSPPFTLIGTADERVVAQLGEIYRGVEAPLEVVEMRAAEMVKYVCNAFHGLKVSFANEIGTICKHMGIDSHQVMDVFCKDTKLNISRAYLRPGFAFGGSCLPKDLRAIGYKARQLDVEVPVLAATLVSNKLHVERAIDMILRIGKRKIGVLGLSYKEGTDDMRESPMVAMIETLIGKGMEITIYDREVREAQIMGANREFIEREIPHIWKLMRGSVDDVLAEGETIVIGNGAEEFRDVESRVRPGQIVVDLVRMFGDRRTEESVYEGICW